MIKRNNERSYDEIRSLKIQPNYYSYAEGSCLIELGNTKLICAVTVEDRVPLFMKGSGKGWITAEYGMLPKSSNGRIEREAAKGKQTGRTQEIQRLIGRSLRACVDLTKLGEKQIKIDCDVLQADGGTRTAAISGAYVALRLALQKMHKTKILKAMPIIHEVAAISCGIVKGDVLLDLDYSEDSIADVDANFVLTSNCKIIEVQASAEQTALKEEYLLTMLSLAKKGIKLIVEEQRKALEIDIK